MLFKILLWIINVRIKSLIKFSKQFRYAISNTRIILQFATNDTKVKRYFEFDRGRYSSKPSMHIKHMMALSKGMLGERIAILNFSSAQEAVWLFIRAIKDQAAMLQAIQEKKLNVEGDFTLFLWFGWLSKQL